MPQRKATVERLAVFSDGVFAVIITIMVLDVRPPERPTLAALALLWPTALSYTVSYVLIAIVWLNHHHLLRFAEYPTLRLMWIHFVHLFMLSLAPFATAWVASTRLASVPVFVYPAVFFLVELAYFQFEHDTLTHAVIEEISPRTRRLAKMHSFLAFRIFLAAMLVALRFPQRGFGLVCCGVFLYLQPEPLELRRGSANTLEQASDVSVHREAEEPSTRKQHIVRELLGAASKE
jgi:uncharacterized membrane protein